MKKVVNQIRPTLQQQGFFLLEVLIGVIVILGITILYVQIQNHKHQEAFAKIMTQQINLIMNAATNYYQENGGDWPPSNISIQTLIDDNYLQENDATSPFGTAYELDSDSDQKILTLYTTLPGSEGYVAHKAITPLADSAVSNNTGNGKWTIEVKMSEPSALIDPKAVRYMTIVKNNTKITKDNITCPTNYSAQIYTAVSSCKSENNNPLNGCMSYAEENSNDSWTVYMRVMTQTGWQDDSNSDNTIQVSLRCKKNN